jgi:hypothetical protein
LTDRPKTYACQTKTKTSRNGRRKSREKEKKKARGKQKQKEEEKIRERWEEKERRSGKRERERETDVPPLDWEGGRGQEHQEGERRETLRRHFWRWESEEEREEVTRYPSLRCRCLEASRGRGVESCGRNTSPISLVEALHPEWSFGRRVSGYPAFSASQSRCDLWKYKETLISPLNLDTNCLCKMERESERRPGLDGLRVMETYVLPRSRKKHLVITMEVVTLEGRG